MPKNFIDTNNADGTGSYYRQVIGASQPKPYDKPLPYEYKFIRTITATKSGLYTSFGNMANAGSSKGNLLAGPRSWEDDVLRQFITQATNKCLDKFYNELDEAAMLAVNFAERQQAIGMMGSRLMQLARFAKALKKFDLVMAAKSLGLDPESGIPKVYRPGKKPKGWSNAKQRGKIVANAWLEFHFGWEPLVKDIFHTIQILQSPMSGKTIEVKASVPLKSGIDQVVGFEQISRSVEGYVLHKCGATLHVTDANAYAANRLGLTNPAAVVWELIPFSFVVDWFTTVGSFINQWTDLDGVKLIDPWNATTLSITSEYSKLYALDGSALYVLSEGVLFSRQLGIERYKIAFRPLKRLSMVRAATAIALLMQFLPR